jgi:hypothetical protein
MSAVSERVIRQNLGQRRPLVVEGGPTRRQQHGIAIDRLKREQGLQEQVLDLAECAHVCQVGRIIVMGNVLHDPTNIPQGGVYAGAGHVCYGGLAGRVFKSPHLKLYVSIL